MPLLDLKTNLTSLKFGRDRLNSGDSGQPYIKTPIIGDRYATQNPPPDLIEYASTNRNSLDYPIRGGNVDFQIGTQTLTISSKIDKERIKRFLNDAPRGTAFVQKQIGLQLTNPKTETGTSISNAFGDVSALPGILENTRVYNFGKNTEAQVGVSGTGFHLPRHGLFPFDTLSKYYKDIVGAQNRMSSTEVQNENRLLILQQLKLRSTEAIVANGQVLGAIEKINQLGISLNRNVLQAYVGGPGSVYGIGNTTIRRFDDTSAAVRKTRRGMSYDEILSQNISEANNPNTVNTIADSVDPTAKYNYPLQFRIQDFKTGDYFLSSEGKLFNNRESLYGMSNGYNPGEEISSPDAIAQKGVKSYINNAWEESSLDPNNYYSNLDNSDMIKFGFECINNDDPALGIFLQFRAYLTNGITDNNQANYNAFKYLGRGEDFFIYQGFTRTIGFSFRMAVENPKDLVPLYNKLNALVSQVYPDYSNKGIMRTSLTRVTIGDYIYRMPGFLESVNVTTNQDSSWEIEPGKQVPHYVDVNVTFRPIHEDVPKRVKSTDEARLILYNNTNKEAPSNLNEDFYKRELTPAERTSIQRAATRERKKAERKAKRAERKAKNAAEIEAKKRANATAVPNYF